MSLAHEVEIRGRGDPGGAGSPLRRLAELREAGAHLTAFGPSVTWHEAVERWLGDLGSLRLSGSPEALVERNALVHSIRATGATTRAIRERLGISSYAVQQALAEHDPAPDRIVGADGASRSCARYSGGRSCPPRRGRCSSRRRSTSAAPGAG
jgi:hypothetical protein